MSARRVRSIVARLSTTIVVLVSSSAGAVAPPPEATRTAIVVSINDVYNVQGLQRGHVGGLARVRSLIREVTAAQGEAPLVLHAGDALFPSLLSGPQRDGPTDGGKHMVEVLNMLVPGEDPASPSNRMLFTIGNHEFDRDQCADAADLLERIAESRFLWLDGNIEFQFDACKTPVPAEAAKRLRTGTVVEIGGIRIGVFGLTTDMARPAYVRRFGVPREVARMRAAELRKQGAEVVIALTHLDLREDRELLADLGMDGPDLVVGGHDHEHAEAFVPAGSEKDDPGAPTTNGRRRRAVFKADAEARSANVIAITLSGGHLTIDRELRTLAGNRPPPDSVVDARVTALLRDHDHRFCSGRREPDGCLGATVGTAGTDLVGDESSLRSGETSLGNWVADTIADLCGTDVALINAGSVRLNDTILAGTPIVLRDVENMVRYPAPLVRFTIDGSTLRKALQHATEGWPGSGQWLLASGLAFAHQPSASGGSPPSRITLVKQQRLVRDDDRIRVATTGFLAKGGDGYTMLTTSRIGPMETCPEPSSLKELLIERLHRSPAGIRPVVDGRVCRGDGPCLAASDTPAPAEGPSVVVWLSLVVLLAMATAVLAS